MNVMQANSEMIHPIPDTQENNNMNVEVPPVLKKKSGRPKKSRKSKTSNASASSSSARSSFIMMRRCSICNAFGHNKRTCLLASFSQRPPIRKSARINNVAGVNAVGVNAEEPASESALNEPPRASSSINFEAAYAAFYRSTI
ncbi:hypothetical protein Lal_00010861 [Lupinus albus]|uniref:Putative transcription factor interactor and regulator CCHC(Zn) family n=1 Tax=Lupinus albus TaxID=3870 RepID=A0A6A4PT67_LUPAL|nr:putative transcription factor interactor and regulator CCHC(Zn) family [Lupinus albus]KAF1892396.1 hypothetical protein Lal_00010861 [Lupinus albus]